VSSLLRCTAATHARWRDGSRNAALFTRPLRTRSMLPWQRLDDPLSTIRKHTLLSTRLYICIWSCDGGKALPYRRASVKQHRQSIFIFVCKMGKVKRSIAGIQKLLKSGRPLSEEVGGESSIQATSSGITEPLSQTVPEVDTGAELSRTLASREEEFADE
jgi:hypothetical protein